ncbi:hypothetical protein KVR01_001570 [Diaporthe batatas]|uniref:uncharacterized protein n=1 Tax=Diaporthe batatas TaxID=748121 RepID=UPI001D055C37|nr:uncharacterized protein KVR01_001570 [Diaporthe batatas]KAG8168821.1 hypothetical protein KVR01_001570 [Diaporthe batatas]
MTVVKTHDFEDTRAIKALIQAFFDSVNAADTKSLQSHFLPAASLTIIRQDPPRPADPAAGEGSSSAAASHDEKLTVVIRTTIEQFVKLLDDAERRRKGQPPGPVVHETPDLDATDVKLDALFGNAWAPFRVTFDGVLHHYGTMVYTLAKTELADAAGASGGRKEWKIAGLTQNYRRTPGWPEAEHSGLS